MTDRERKRERKGRERRNRETKEWQKAKFLEALSTIIITIDMDEAVRVLNVRHATDMLILFITIVSSSGQRRKWLSFVR